MSMKKILRNDCSPHITNYEALLNDSNSVVLNFLFGSLHVLTSAGCLIGVACSSFTKRFSSFAKIADKFINTYLQCLTAHRQTSSRSHKRTLRFARSNELFVQISFILINVEASILQFVKDFSLLRFRRNHLNQGLKLQTIKCGERRFVVEEKATIVLFIPIHVASRRSDWHWNEPTQKDSNYIQQERYLLVTS